MPFPKTEAELKSKGYVLESRGAVCNGPTCCALIDWWLTPKQKRVPMDTGTIDPHWVTCPDATLFRAKVSARA